MGPTCPVTHYLGDGHRTMVMGDPDVAASDETLVQGALNGDQAAFGELYDRWARIIRAICFDTTHNLDAAEDIAQEVFLRALEKLGVLRARRPAVVCRPMISSIFSPKTPLARSNGRVVRPPARPMLDARCSIRPPTLGNTAHALRSTTVLKGPARSAVKP